MSSIREPVMTAVVDLMTASRGKRYEVMRRSVNWQSFPFTKHPWACAIMLDDCSLFRNSKGMYHGTLTIEAFTKIDDRKRIIDGIQDSVLDEIHSDLADAFQKLKLLADDNGNSIIFKLGENGNAVEVYDATLNVQGIVASANIDF